VNETKRNETKRNKTPKKNPQQKHIFHLLQANEEVTPEGLIAAANFEPNGSLSLGGWLVEYAYFNKQTIRNKTKSTKKTSFKLIFFRCRQMKRSLRKV